MKTFLKVVFVVLAALIAIKLLPLTLALGVVLGFTVVALAAIGVSAIALFFGLAITVAAVLSPIWIPVLAVVGLIALLKRGNRREVAA